MPGRTCSHCNEPIRHDEPATYWGAWMHRRCMPGWMRGGSTVLLPQGTTLEVWFPGEREPRVRKVLP